MNTSRQKRIGCRKACVAALAVAFPFGAAQAFEFDTGNPDISARWDNTVRYNLGVRAERMDPKIGNNPLLDESDYKFKDRGDVVTNRLSVLSEFDVAYKRKIGFRLSGSAWKDWAYDDNVKYNPGNFAPGLPYSALGSYRGGKYSNSTKRFYNEGGQLLDAFLWSNFDVGGHGTSVKVGRLTQYWGNALFFGSQGINYSQNASDNIKASTSPGTQAKELAIPREQLLVQTELTPELSVAAQYFWAFQGNRLPAGGTYLGVVDFLFSGPNQMMGGALMGGAPHGKDFKPDDRNDNFGVKLTWSPSWLDGSLGAYYRRMDETQPWAPLMGVNPATGAVDYHLAYAQDVDLYGLSLETQLAGFSVGTELSYRRNTALNSATGPLPGDLAGKEGARGNTLNLIVNAMSILTPTALYDTGTLLGEIAFTRKLSVTRNAALYNGVGNPLACPSGSKWDGCSTDNSVSLALMFTPQWLQVYPGVDIDTPLFVMYGLRGNTASLGTTVAQGAAVYTAGVHAEIFKKYHLTLQYNGYYARTRGLAYTGTGSPYYAGGNGPYMYNDRNWVSLTFSTTF